MFESIKTVRLLLLITWTILNPINLIIMISCGEKDIITPVEDKKDTVVCLPSNTVYENVYDDLSSYYGSISFNYFPLDTVTYTQVHEKCPIEVTPYYRSDSIGHYLYKLDDKTLLKLTNGPVTNPVWSEDGQFLLLLAGGTIKVLSFDGNKLTETFSLSNSRLYSNVRISPSNLRITYDNYTGDTTGIWYSDIGGPIEYLGNGSLPIWLSDTTILFKRSDSLFSTTINDEIAEFICKIPNEFIKRPKISVSKKFLFFMVTTHTDSGLKSELVKCELENCYCSKLPYEDINSFTLISEDTILYTNWINDPNEHNLKGTLWKVSLISPFTRIEFRL